MRLVLARVTPPTSSSGSSRLWCFSPFVAAVLVQLGLLAVLLSQHLTSSSNSSPQAQGSTVPASASSLNTSKAVSRRVAVPLGVAASTAAGAATASAALDSGDSSPPTVPLPDRLRDAIVRRQSGKAALLYWHVQKCGELGGTVNWVGSGFTHAAQGMHS